MRDYLSSFVFGFLGIGAGFALCFVYLVLPERVNKTGAQPQFVTIPMRTRSQAEWKPHLIQLTIPPRIVAQ
jgi:hypothetical protein